MGEARRRRLTGAGFKGPSRKEKGEQKTIAQAKEIEPPKSKHPYKLECGKDEECFDCEGVGFDDETDELVCIRDNELSY